MSKNYIKEVASLLGVEVGEKFNIKGVYGNPYHFDKKYCLVDKYNKKSHYTLGDLLLGVKEINKSILDETEREYLKRIIEPFKEDVRYITKQKNKYRVVKDCYISIYMFSEVMPIQFPYLKNKKMYKGMEINKEYTLKELGLDE